MRIEIKKEQQRKGAMARRLVYFCITIMTLTLIWAIALKTAALFIEFPISVDVSDVLTFVAAAFGGELLLLVIKRVFAKPNDQEEETT